MNFTGSGLKHRSLSSHRARKNGLVPPPAGVAGVGAFIGRYTITLLVDLKANVLIGRKPRFLKLRFVYFRLPPPRMENRIPPGMKRQLREKHSNFLDVGKQLN